MECWVNSGFLVRLDVVLVQDFIKKHFRDISDSRKNTQVHLFIPNKMSSSISLKIVAAHVNSAALRGGGMSAIHAALNQLAQV